jgi:hypothetical protein
MVLLGHTVDWRVELNLNLKHEPKIEKVAKKSLQQNEGHLPVVPYCTHQSNERLYAFLSSATDCIW